MGKTCHLPGTRNHLVGDAERLERKPRTTPKTKSGIIIAKSSLESDYWSSYIDVVDEHIRKGVKEGKTDKSFKAFTPESIVWELITPDKWDEIYEKHVENNAYSNSTARSRQRNNVKIRDRMREFQQGLLLDSHWNIDPETGLCIPPPALGEYALDREQYVKIDNQTIGLSIDQHEADNRELLENDAKTITAMLHYAGVKVSVVAEDINTSIAIASGSQIPTRRNQSVTMPTIPARAIGFDEMRIF